MKGHHVLGLAAAMWVAFTSWPATASADEPIELAVQILPKLQAREDGSRVVGASSGDGAFEAFAEGGRVWLYRSGTRQVVASRPYAASDSNVRVTFAPGGRSLAILAGGVLELVDTSDGTVRRVPSVRGDRLVFTTEGRYLCVATPGPRRQPYGSLPGALFVLDRRGRFLGRYALDRGRIELLQRIGHPGQLEVLSSGDAERVARLRTFSADQGRFLPERDRRLTEARLQAVLKGLPSRTLGPVAALPCRPGPRRLRVTADRQCLAYFGADDAVLVDLRGPAIHVLQGGFQDGHFDDHGGFIGFDSRRVRRFEWSDRSAVRETQLMRIEGRIVSVSPAGRHAAVEVGAKLVVRGVQAPKPLWEGDRTRMEVMWGPTGKPLFFVVEARAVEAYRADGRKLGSFQPSGRQITFATPGKPRHHQILLGLAIDTGGGVVGVWHAAIPTFQAWHSDATSTFGGGRLLDPGTAVVTVGRGSVRFVKRSRVRVPTVEDLIAPLPLRSLAMYEYRSGAAGFQLGNALALVAPESRHAGYANSLEPKRAVWVKPREVLACGARGLPAVSLREARSGLLLAGSWFLPGGAWVVAPADGRWMGSADAVNRFDWLVDGAPLDPKKVLAMRDPERVRAQLRDLAR